ncbi:MAG TPA: hypothetical protein VHV50_10390 [Actinomycetota bacterium]|nr:hypothetical protein [Actinomycetota bacterium]
MRTFVIDSEYADDPSVTFGGLNVAAQPRVLYGMLWRLPRLDA